MTAPKITFAFWSEAEVTTCAASLTSNRPMFGPPVTLSRFAPNPSDSEGNSDPYGKVSGLAPADVNYEYGDTTSVLTLPLAPVAYLMGTMIVVTAAIHLWLIFVPHRDDDGKSII